ncbi:MAG: coenzyme F420-0:L-glutamate ligase [Antricoccus sp.]
MSDAPIEQLSTEIVIRPVLGLPDFAPGDDLTGAILQNVPDLRDGDVLVVTSKAVSKCEGRLVRQDTGPDARATALREQTMAVVAQRGPTTIVRNRLGLTMAAAGIDASNVTDGFIALLPEDPDASAREIRRVVEQRRGIDVAVLITDTVGRPWREGLVDIAIGAAGMEALRDLRGTVDTHGRPLAVTALAQIDEIASASELVRGKLAEVPAAVVRGVPWRPAVEGDTGGARQLVRPHDSDMFALGCRDVVPATASGTTEGPVPDHLIDEAIGALPQSSAKVHRTGNTVIINDESDLKTGVVIGLLLAALRAEGLAGTVNPATGQITVSLAAPYQGRV